MNSAGEALEGTAFPLRAAAEVDAAALEKAGLRLCETERGLELTDGRMSVRADFSKMLPRLAAGRLHRELLVRAAKVKGFADAGRIGSGPEAGRGLQTLASPMRTIAFDATAGLGEGARPLAVDATAGLGEGARPNAVGAAGRGEDALPLAVDAAGSGNGLQAPASPTRLLAVDATAGLGEDALLLAAAGFELRMYERNPVIAALLQDGLRRAAADPRLSAIVARMSLEVADSEQALANLDMLPDVVLLDPMFPGRQKSAQVKKKLQLLQRLERPCDDEQALLNAALAACPRKVVVKRPAKGPHLADRAPSYSLSGKAVRYDCYIIAREC